MDTGAETIDFKTAARYAEELVRFGISINSEKIVHLMNKVQNEIQSSSKKKSVSFNCP